MTYDRMNIFSRAEHRISLFSILRIIGINKVASIFTTLEAEKRHRLVPEPVDQNRRPEGSSPIIGASPSRSHPAGSRRYKLSIKPRKTKQRTLISHPIDQSNSRVFESRANSSPEFSHHFTI